MGFFVTNLEALIFINRLWLDKKVFGLGSIIKKVAGLWTGLGNRLKSIFSSGDTGALNFDKLEKLLLESDVGSSVCHKLISAVKEDCSPEGNTDLETVTSSLSEQLHKILSSCPQTNLRPKILLLVGVNGAGKTTFSAKLANLLSSEGKKPLLVAADTFRAAAGEQLSAWAAKTNTTLVEGKQDQDPGSVIFSGATQFVEQSFDHLIIDTAGRLHTKTNLMAELEKIHKILTKKLGSQTEVSTWLVLDSMLGQSSISQAEVFNNSTKLDGIVLTKCEGASKGGGIFAIADKFKIPVVFTSYGQELSELKDFDAHNYIKQFLN